MLSSRCLSPLRRLLTLASLVAVPASAQVGADAAVPLPSPEDLERAGAVVGEIRVEVQNIFDPAIPEEDRHLFRLANRLHRTTRPSVIEELILFRPGDRYSRGKIEESERLLRASHFFYDPAIRAVRYQDNRVDLEVVGQDLWTLKGGVGVGRSGGANSTRFQIEDTNLFGTGKVLNLERTSNVDRTSTLLHFEDPNVTGRRLKVGLDYSSNSDGSLRAFEFDRPFYSLDASWAAGVSARSEDRVDSIYQLGHATDQFHHRQELGEVFGGLSAGRHSEHIHRWTAGFTFLRDRFSPALDRSFPSSLPADRTLSFPWVAFDALPDEYSKTRNFNQIGRVEDLSLGGRYHVRLGWSLPALGAERSEAVFDGSATWACRSAKTAASTLLISGEASGRLGSDGGRNVLAGGRAQLYRRNFGEQLFLASLEADVAHALDPETQLLLGGDSGLRGYPLRYQDGDRRVLLTLEQRIFTDWYPFRLFHVGAAAFFDAGRTWWSGPERGAPNLGLLKDVGLGLRLGSRRSAHGSVVHLDAAFPLDGDPSIRRVQFLVTTRAGF
jgi:hypothetical protein